VSLLSDANKVGLNGHSVKLIPAAVANEFAKNLRRVNILTSNRLSEGEGECLYTRIEESNFACSIFHWPLPAYQLIKPVTLYPKGCSNFYMHIHTSVIERQVHYLL